MESQHIRVLLDISELKDRLHKYVWMLVSTSDLKSIADFKDAVIKKLALDRNVNDIKMFINKGLLLEEESILVLRENDSVQIQYENISTTDLNITSCLEVQDSLISDVGLSSRLSIDKLSKAVEKSKKKKRLSEVVIIDAPNSCKEEYSHKRKRKSDLVHNDSSENRDSVNLSPEESAITFCDANEESVYNEKKKKRKKSCSATMPKEHFIENVQHNIKTQEKIDATIWDINEENIYQSKQTKQAQCSSTSMATIQIEDDNEKKVICVESAFVISDNNERSTSKEKKRKSCSNSTSNTIILNQHCEDEEISIIPVEISLDDSSQEINKMEISSNSQSNVTIEPFVQSNSCKKKKRRRHRPRRIEQNLVSPFMPENISTLQKPVTDPPTVICYDNCSNVRKHIRYTSPEPDSKMEEPELVDLETCNLECVSEISLETSLNKSCISSNTKTLSTINGRDGNDTTCVVNVNGPNMNAAYSQKSFELNSSNVSPSKSNYLHELSLKNPVSKNKEYEPSRNVAMDSTYSPLNTLPCIGTCIAFKLLELNASYSPEVSSYKEGVIKSINPKTEEIEIELTKKEIKPGRIGKFENLKEGELPGYEVTNKVKTCWSSLIEPRLVSRE